MNDNEKKRVMEEECNIARSVDMVYLVKLFGYTPYRSGNTHRLKEYSSFVIFNDTNTFHHYAHQGEPGYAGSPIDFCMTYGDMSKKEAIHYLLDVVNYNKERCVNIISRKEAQEKINLELPEANSNYRRAFAYLCRTRGIAGDVISFFMHEKRLYESLDRHNCVFVTYDDEGVPKYASMRGTMTVNTFKGDVYGSDKSYGFPLYRGSDTVWVFEAPVDMMSFMTLYPDNKDNLCALGCLGTDALKSFLGKHTDVKKIGFILDNDKSAPKVVATAKVDFESKGYTILEHELNSLLKSTNSKDVNEYLLKSRGNTANKIKQR